jgi:hypothetical protein
MCSDGVPRSPQLTTTIFNFFLLCLMWKLVYLIDFGWCLLATLCSTCAVPISTAVSLVDTPEFEEWVQSPLLGFGTPPRLIRGLGPNLPPPRLRATGLVWSTERFTLVRLCRTILAPWLTPLTSPNSSLKGKGLLTCRTFRLCPKRWKKLRVSSTAWMKAVFWKRRGGTDWLLTAGLYTLTKGGGWNRRRGGSGRRVDWGHQWTSRSGHLRQCGHYCAVGRRALTLLVVS